MSKTGYPIRAVSKLTGLSIDTLRAWERRYQVVLPERSGRDRLYSESDLQRLNLLREAVDQGYSIGHLSTLNNQQIQDFLNRTTPAFHLSPGISPVSPLPKQLDLTTVFSALERFDTLEADRELSRYAALLAPRALVDQVVIPLMHKVGDAWFAGTLSIAQEHLMSAVLRNLLGAMIRLYLRSNPPATLLFATPTNEHHEFGILAAAMLAAGGGLGVVYLGIGLPAQEIVTAAQKTSARAVLLGAKGALGWEPTLKEIQAVAENLSDPTELWLGGSFPEKVAPELNFSKIILLEDFTALEHHLIRLGAKF